MKLQVSLIIVLCAVSYLGDSQETIKGLNGKENNTRTLAQDYCADRKEGNTWGQSSWNYLCTKIIERLCNGCCSDQSNILWYLLIEQWK